jgi:pimeloyl-ACP methyl ester carboxylesterase
VERCVKPGPDTRIVRLADLGASVVVIGSGSRGAVMANQSGGGNLCEWLPLARGLARAGMRALLYDYVGGDSDDDLLATVRELRREGVHRVTLVGASVGGRLALHTAARAPEQVEAVATLSAERTGRSGYPTLDDARSLRVPALYLGTREDGYTTFGAETRTLYRVTRAAGKRLVLLPGAEHGTDLLKRRDAARVIRTITRFVHG